MVETLFAPPFPARGNAVETKTPNVATLVLPFAFVLELPLPLSFATFVGMLTSFGRELVGCTVPRASARGYPVFGHDDGDPEHEPLLQKNRSFLS